MRKLLLGAALCCAIPVAMLAQDNSAGDNPQPKPPAQDQSGQRRWKSQAWRRRNPIRNPR